MNILLISHYAGAPQYGMEFRSYYMAREWVRQGHQVTVVGASFSHLRHHQPPTGEETLEGIHVCVVGTVILELILDELECRKTYTVEGYMVCRTSSTWRNCLESQRFKRSFKGQSMNPWPSLTR